MRKLLVILFITATLPAFAQTTPAPRGGKKPVEATATPEPKKSFLGRIFGKPTVKATPTPTPSPTPAKPKPKIVKPKPTPTPAPPETPATDTPQTPEPVAVQPVPAQPENTKPAKPDKKPVAVPPKIATTAKTKPEKPDVSALDDTAKYQAIKQVAAQDPEIVELRSKADSAIDEAEAKKTSIAYNRALFQKIRALEPSLDAYVDKLEQAVLKRLK
jgi:hypothetical protein